MILGQRVRLRPIEREDFRDGAYRDTLLMGLLRPEWDSQVAAAAEANGATGPESI